MKKHHLDSGKQKTGKTTIAALAALGLSVGITTEVGAKPNQEDLKIIKEADAKKLQTDKKLKEATKLKELKKSPGLKQEFVRPPPP